MSRLTSFADHAPDVALLRPDDAERIAAERAPIGGPLERWDSLVAIGENDDAEPILDRCRPHLDRLMGASNAGSADVIRIRPDAPNDDLLRQRCLPEHTHPEDEVRFFAAAGSFAMNIDGRVFDAYRTRGDLISVPANVRYWFDAGPTPEPTALRIFTDTAGWTPPDTGDVISQRVPVE